VRCGSSADRGGLFSLARSVSDRLHSCAQHASDRVRLQSLDKAVVEAKPLTAAHIS